MRRCDESISLGFILSFLLESTRGWVGRQGVGLLLWIEGDLEDAGVTCGCLARGERNGVFVTLLPVMGVNGWMVVGAV